MLARLGYGGAWGRNFSIMNTEAVAHCGSTVAAKIHYIMNNQACNGGVIQGELAAHRQRDIRCRIPASTERDDAPYLSESTTYAGIERQVIPAAGRDAGGRLFRLCSRVSYNRNGCAGGGSNGDYSTLARTTFSFYEKGRVLRGRALPNRTYLSEGGYPSAAWMAQSWLQGQQLRRVHFRTSINWRKLNSALAGPRHRSGATSTISMPTSGRRSRICVRLQWARK